jgi:hypothetical protein
MSISIYAIGAREKKLKCPTLSHNKGRGGKRTGTQWRQMVSLRQAAMAIIIVAIEV